MGGGALTRDSLGLSGDDDELLFVAHLITIGTIVILRGALPAHVVAYLPYFIYCLIMFSPLNSFDLTSDFPLDLS